MDQRTLRIGVVCLAAVFLAGGLFAAEKSMAIGSATGAAATLPITMTSNEDVQGFVLAVSYDAAYVEATDVVAAGATTAAGAELVVPEILASGFTLGVVLDFNPPYGGQVIPQGSNVLIANATMAATAVVPCGDTLTVPVVFETSGLNSPPLYNILVVDGLSIGESEGLALTNGQVTIPGTCDTLRIVSASGLGGTDVAVTVEVDNLQPVEGYVLSIQHANGATLESITTAGTDAAAVGIEFEVPKLYPTGGTLGVVFDFDPPYGGQTLAPGTKNSLATFVYSNPEFECSAPDKVFALTFVNEVFGTPPLSNVLVEGGFSTDPTLVDGTVTFTCKTILKGGVTFYAGADTGGEEPELICAVGSADADAKVTFYYTSVDKDDASKLGDPIQGMSMAVCFDPRLAVVDIDAVGQGIVTDKQLEGTITKGINAEFVSFNASNVTSELIIGILVDSTPPIPINHMYPPRFTLGKVINIYFHIPADAECETSYTIAFCEGIKAAGEVPIYNRAAIFNQSFPANYDNAAGGACLFVGGKAAFIRGDCNTDQWVDIADPAATMSYLFLGVFDPACLDACDSNDDGVVDLADVASTLRFLFKLGPILPPPGPYPPGGFDPTPDIYGLDLGCEAGDPCN